jgi:ABC-type branched-subunit amino acid transport system substrate-binding protein
MKSRHPRAAGARRRPLALVAALFALASMASACSSSSAPGTAASSSAPAAAGSSAAATTSTATGTPVDIMVISTFNNPAVDFSPNYEGAEVAADAINQAGGIGGHKVVIEHCNDQFTSNAALACARQAVTGKVIATVADETSFGNVVNPILTQAKIPAVGIEAESSVDWDSPAAFPIVTLLPWSEVMVVAKEHNDTKVGWAYVNAPGAQGEELAAESTTTGPLGIKIVASPAVSYTATNYTNYAQELKSAGAEAVVLELATGQIPAMINAANSIGYHPLWLGNSGAIGPAGYKSFGSIATGISLAEQLPPITATTAYPAMATWSGQISAAGMSGVTNISDANAENGWLSVWAIAKFYDQQMKGAALTGPALYAALTSDTSTPVDLFGIMSWTPGASGPDGYGRMASGDFWPSHVSGDSGTIVLNSSDPVDFYTTVGLK